MPTPTHLEKAFEDTIEHHLLTHGWHQGSAANYNRELGLDTVEMFTFIHTTQPNAWTKLVKMHGSTQKAETKLARRIANEINARGTIDVLRRGITDLGVKIRTAYFAPAHNLSPELHTLYNANRTTITRQLHMSETHTRDSLDLALFLNGIPVATAELKTAMTGQTVDDAIAQYRNNRQTDDLIFSNRALVHFAVDTDNVYMTTRLEGTNTVFLPFNQGSGGGGKDGGKGNPANPDGHRSAYLWENVWDRDNWLHVLGFYVHIEHKMDMNGKRTGTTTTVFPRYHQWHAVTSLISATRTEGPGKNKLIQHSAGSGKSNSIAWLAHGLSTLHTPSTPEAMSTTLLEEGFEPNQPIFDKVIVITDRVVLDRQLQDTIASFEHTPGVVETIGDGKTSADLHNSLESKKARIIVTTLQKFPVVAASATKLGGCRFAVIVDEAHSSQSGAAAKDLKAVLSGLTGADALAAAAEADAAAEAETKDIEDLLADSVMSRGRRNNLTFYAFTATPKHKTLSLFGETITGADGEETHVPFHLYSMRQAIEEGFILDVLANYTTYTTYYRLANGLSNEDPEVPRGKTAAKLARYVALHPTNLAQKAEIVVEFFRNNTQHKIGGHAKAMVVTSSRIHAVRYHQAINDYIHKMGYDKGEKPIRAIVAFSGTVEDPDTKILHREALANKFSETQLPERFATDECQILVVADKYQTGFDQPLLHTMFVDKKLGDVRAVQTLSRLNRIADGKEDTFVLDFANSIEDIQAAFQPYYQQTTATPTDPNVLYNLQTRIMAAHVIDADDMRAAVTALLAPQTGASGALDAAVEPAVQRWKNLDEDEQEDFRTAVRDYLRAYAFLAQVVPFQDPELEELYYYGKYLGAKIAKIGADSGGVDVDISVLLTHLRTECQQAEHDASLSEEEVAPLQGVGDGQGKQYIEPVEPLSVLLEEINAKHGKATGWLEQKANALCEVDEVRTVAQGNDFDQFRIYLEPKLDDEVSEQHQVSDKLLQAYFDDAEFRRKATEWVAQSLYDRIRDNRQAG